MPDCLRWCLAVVFATCSAASGQGTATWEWAVSTQDGDAVVHPGETATVSLSLNFSPDVSYPDGPVLGLEEAVFSTLGGTNADQGMILDWSITENLLFLMREDTTTTDGVSLFDTTAAQSVDQDIFLPFDPLAVLEFEWEPAEEGAYTVEYSTSTAVMAVWEKTGKGNEGVEWFVEEAEISFAVVPAPSGVVIVIGAALCALSRRTRWRLTTNGG